MGTAGRWTTYVKVSGTWRYLYRAIDQFGQVVDVYFSERRDAGAARLFFSRAVASTQIEPTEVVTDRAQAYRRVAELALVIDRLTEPTLRTVSSSNNATEPAERRCAYVSRQIAKLRGHGLIAKVPRHRLYRPTPYGQRVMSAAIAVHNQAFPIAYAAA